MIKLYTVSEVAKILRVKKSYIYELIYTGQLKAIRMSQRRYRIMEEDLVQYLNHLKEQEKQNRAANR